MPKSFSFTFHSVDEFRRLPGTWMPSDYRRLLEALDVEGFEGDSDGDLEDVVLMALQDLDVDEAALTILTHFSEGRFSPGQIKNLCHEIQEDRPWEEYPNIAHQKVLYVCVDLLSAAFPLDCSTPTATRLDLSVTAPGLDSINAKRPLDSAILLRGISRCQEDDSILNRFFSDQIAGAAFPEAPWVVWHMEATSPGIDTLQVGLWGSSYWFEDVEEDTERSCVLEWAE